MVEKNKEEINNDVHQVKNGESEVLNLKSEINELKIKLQTMNLIRERDELAGRLKTQKSADSIPTTEEDVLFFNTQNERTNIISPILFSRSGAKRSTMPASLSTKNIPIKSVDF